MWLLPRDGAFLGGVEGAAGSSAEVQVLGSCGLLSSKAGC